MFFPQTQEPLRDTVTTLEHENARLKKEIANSNTLLDALASLLLIDTNEEPFRYVFQSLHDVFQYDLAAAFIEHAPDTVICLSSTQDVLIGKNWLTGRFLTRVLHGHIAATIRNQDIPEAIDAPAGLMQQDGTALFIPLTMSAGHGFLMLAKNPGKSGFNRTDITLAQKFSVLASHAMQASSSRRQIQAREVRAQAAERTSRQQSQFISNMSHELRTPLNAIIGFSEVIGAEMLGPIGTPKYSEYVNDINVSGNQLLALVDNILLYSKIEAGQHDVDLQTQDLHKTLTRLCPRMQYEADKQRIPLYLDNISTRIEILADARSLDQILLNLIDNAIKFSATGQAVHIRGHLSQNSYCLQITDNGPGIPENIRRRLGEPFTQGEGVLARSHHGTGLGLAISYRLAQSMGAELWLDSIEGEGTTANLELPLCPPANSNHGAKQRIEQGA